MANEKHGISSGAKFLIIIAICMLIFMLGFGIAYKFAVTSSSSNNVLITVDPDKAIPVEIPMGANTDKIATILKDNEIIKSTFYFKLISKLNWRRMWLSSILKQEGAKNS